MSSKRTLVFDIGSHSIKVGFGGDNQPKDIIRNVIAYPNIDSPLIYNNTRNTKRSTMEQSSFSKEPKESKEPKDENGDENTTTNLNELDEDTKESEKEKEKEQEIKENDKKRIEIPFRYGNLAVDWLNRYRTDIKLRSLMEHGEIIDFRRFELLIQSIYNENLSIKADDYANYNAILTDHPLTPKQHRYKLASLFFEQFNCEKLNIEYSGILSMYGTGSMNGCVVDCGHQGTGSMNGCVVDCGHQGTEIIPIIDGCMIQNNIQRINVGGAQVTLYLQHLLRKSGITLHTSAGIETLNDIKEKLNECSLKGYVRTSADEEENNCVRYELPDGKIIQIGLTQRMRAAEVLFSPHLLGIDYREDMLGIQKCLLNSINNNSNNIRTLLSSNIILIGGTSYLKNFPRRLLNECSKYDDNNNYHYKTSLYTTRTERSRRNNATGTAASRISMSSSSVSNLTGMGGLSSAITTTTTTTTSMSGSASASSLLPDGNAITSTPVTTNPSNENKDESEENLYYKNLLLYKNKKSEYKKTKLKIRAPTNRNIISWIGGSIVAQNNDFQTSLMIDKKQFKEYGYSILFR